MPQVGVSCSKHMTKEVSILPAGSTHVPTHQYQVMEQGLHLWSPEDPMERAFLKKKKEKRC